MRTPKLSIIIPVYNVASYIEESVYSLFEPDRNPGYGDNFGGKWK